jgi:hypothetical protein
MPDLNLWLTAENMIKNHGGSAAMEAAMIAEKMDKRGDKEGYEVWLRITNAIRELARAPNHAN